MTPEQARLTIARHLTDCLLSHHDVLWEDWPDVGQSDWEAIDQLIREQGTTFQVRKGDLDVAYKVLSDRADHGGEERVSVYTHHAEGCTFNEGGKMQWVCVEACPSFALEETP